MVIFILFCIALDDINNNDCKTDMSKNDTEQLQTEYAIIWGHAHLLLCYSVNISLNERRQ